MINVIDVKFVIAVNHLFIVMYLRTAFLFNVGFGVPLASVTSAMETAFFVGAQYGEIIKSYAAFTS